jgi:hypothetical protein
VPSQLDRYGERTARGNAAGKKVLWALALKEKRRARNRKNIIQSRDHVSESSRTREGKS